MIFKGCKYTYLLFLFVTFSCAKTIENTETSKKEVVKTEILGKNTKNYPSREIITSAEQIDLYLPKLTKKKVGIVGNQSSVIKISNNKYVHLVDSLLTLRVDIRKVFSPEHGFRGEADAGEYVNNKTDPKTKLPIISLYGKNKKPTKKQLQGLDIVVFDLQDVGVRFYTYISTLHYVMEACAENNIPLIVLDRPNPNGHYVDGPVLKLEHKSFIGMHPVPVVYGMTIGEYAQMINGEKWLKNAVKCDLTVIPLKNYTHKKLYDLPVKPSPNLPNATSVNLYPSLCFLEGTKVSCGRGTNMQFQIYGSPYLENKGFSFTPRPNKGSKLPKHNRRVCYGEDLRNTPRLSKIDLSWIMKAHQQTSMVKTTFWDKSNLFTRLAGNTELKQQIIKGLTEEQIRKTWQKDLENFMPIRLKYLIYK